MQALDPQCSVSLKSEAQAKRGGRSRGWGHVSPEKEVFLQKAEPSKTAKQQALSGTLESTTETEPSGGSLESGAGHKGSVPDTHSSLQSGTWVVGVEDGGETDPLAHHRYKGKGVLLRQTA